MRYRSRRKQVTTHAQAITSPADVFRNFINTCRSPATVQGYTRALHYFMDYLRVDRDAYDKLLDKHPSLIQMDICNFITYLRKEKCPPVSSATVSMYAAAIKKFYAMNDVTLNVLFKYSTIV